MTPPTPKPKLLTRDQVLAHLRQERDRDGLAAVARRYGLPAQQICDCLSSPPRARLSKKMIAAMSFKLWELYEKTEGGAVAGMEEGIEESS